MPMILETLADALHVGINTGASAYFAMALVLGVALLILGEL